MLVDCDPQTWNIDPAQVEASITPRTTAILGVHLYGNPCNADALSQIAKRHGLKLLFDAAHAFGASYGNQAVGSLGDAEVFSLSPTKLLVAGEGGIVTTNDSYLAKQLKAARNYGDTGTYDPELRGLNARMSEFNAALALTGLDLIDAKVAHHNEIAERYTRHLSGIPGLSLQQVRPNDTSTYKDFSIHIENRDHLAEVLEAKGIPTKKYFHPPVHRQKLYTNAKAGTLKNTERISSGILSLPIYHALTNEEVDQVAEAILNV